jgi:hypothetical protein
VRVYIATVFLLPGSIHGGYAVKVENILASISAQKTLSLNTALEVVALAILVPDGVLLNAESLGKLLENRLEVRVGSHNLLTLNTTVVDLVLTGLTLLEDTRDNTLANNTFAKVVDNNGTGGEQARNIELVHGLDTQNILANGNAGGLVATLGGESTNTVSTEGVEDVVVDEDLSLTGLGRVQRSNLTTSNQNGTTGSSLIVISKQLGGQTLAEDTVLDSLARQLAGSLELLVPVTQGLGVVHARDQVTLLRAGKVGLVGVLAR